MQAINFYIIHMLILVLAEFILSFYVIFIMFKILRKNELLFSKGFYIFVFGASLISVIVNRLFEFSITQIDVVSGIWMGLTSFQKLGLMLVPAFILMYAYFYLASASLKLKSRDVLILILVLGIVNSPWKILL